MDKTERIKKEAEFSFEDTKANYLRTNEMIKISYSGWMYWYSITIYKNGTLDYERYASYGTKEVKEGLKNPLIDKYNYNSIKNFVEKGKHNSRKVMDYLYNLIMDLSSVVHNND